MTSLGMGLGLSLQRALALPFGSDPTSGAFVTAQWNFHDKTTADLSGGLLDETGNWTLSFHAEAAIDGNGYLYRNGTPDGSVLASIASCNSDDFSILETVAGGAFGYGVCAILMKIPSPLAVNAMVLAWTASSGALRWGFNMRYEGDVATEGGALVADGSGGWNTNLKNVLATIPEDGTKFLYSLSGRDLASNDQALIRYTDENEGTAVVGTLSLSATGNAGGSATHIFQLTDYHYYKAIRIGRDHPSAGESIIGAGVDGTSNGFPALT